MPYLIPRRAKLHDVLSLQRLIEDARDDLARAKYALSRSREQLRVGELATGTADAHLSCIVAVYNRLVVEYEPEERRRR